MTVRVRALLALIARAGRERALPSGAALSMCAGTHGAPRFLQGVHAPSSRISGAARGGSASQGRTAPLLLWLAVAALSARSVAQQVPNFTIALSSAPSAAPKSRYSPSVMGVNMGA